MLRSNMAPDVILMGLINIIGYFIPGIAAFLVSHPKKKLIFKINLFAGWTVVGWFLALFLIFSGEENAVR